MPENQTTRSCRAEKDRSWEEKKRNIIVKVDLKEQYRRIGIAAVAAAACSGQDRKDGGR